LIKIKTYTNNKPAKAKLHLNSIEHTLHNRKSDLSGQLYLWRFQAILSSEEEPTKAKRVCKD